MQVLYAWQESTLTLANPFAEFMPEVTANNDVNCGEIIYTAKTVEVIPSDPDPLAKDLSVDPIGLTVNIAFDVRKIGEGGLKADFSLTGKLLSYPSSHTETFTVKIYTFECKA